MDQRWDRRLGSFVLPVEAVLLQQEPAAEPETAACSCGSGIPVTRLAIAGKMMEIVALPLIMQQFREAGKVPSDSTGRELLETVKIYNSVPAEAEQAYVEAVSAAYAIFWKKGPAV